MTSDARRGLSLAGAWVVALALYGIVQLLFPGMGWFESRPAWVPLANFAAGGVLFVAGWAAAIAARPRRRTLAYFFAFVMCALFHAALVFGYAVVATGFAGVIVAPGFGFGVAGTLFYAFTTLQRGHELAWPTPST